MKNGHIPAGPVWRLSEWLTDRLRLGRLDGSNRQQSADIMALAGGRKEAVRTFYLEKVHLVLCLLIAALLAGAALLIRMAVQDRSIPDGMLARPGYGEGNTDEELIVEIDQHQYELSLEIPERLYTNQEVRKLLEQAEEEARSLLLGANESPDEVRSRLFLPASLAGGRVHAEWTAMPYGILDDDGFPEEGIAEEGTLVTLEGELSLQGIQRILTQPVRVFPPAQNGEEAVVSAVHRETGRMNAGSEAEEYYLLPQDVNGSGLKWYYPRDTSLLLLALLLLAVPFLAGALKDQRIREAAQRRRTQLEMDYPDMLWKMTLLIGAGMNISSAFARIAKDYQAEQKQIEMKRYVYEEMLITCNAIRDGVSEGKAYEQFGHRCGLPRYIRLGSILSQNLRKGSKGLGSVLEQEAAEASRLRQSQARKLGEKAGTKLLLPMGMMLCVVFVILVVPAFMAM